MKIFIQRDANMRVAKYSCQRLLSSNSTPRETAGERQLYLNALEQLGYFSRIHKRLHSLECKITRRNALYQANYLVRFFEPGS